jgi:hypothetical protein
LERRLRTEDGRMEVHVVSFGDEKEMEGYRADPRRAALAGLFDESGAHADVASVADVTLSSGVLDY